MLIGASMLIVVEPGAATSCELVAGLLFVISVLLSC